MTKWLLSADRAYCFVGIEDGMRGFCSELTSWKDGPVDDRTLWIEFRLLFWKYYFVINYAIDITDK